MRLTKDYYKLNEVQECLGVTQRTLYNYIKGGKLQAVKQGGLWKVSKEELTAFLKGNK